MKIDRFVFYWLFHPVGCVKIFNSRPRGSMNWNFSRRCEQSSHNICCLSFQLWLKFFWFRKFNFGQQFLKRINKILNWILIFKEMILLFRRKTWRPLLFIICSDYRLERRSFKPIISSRVYDKIFFNNWWFKFTFMWIIYAKSLYWSLMELYFLQAFLIVFLLLLVLYYFILSFKFLFFSLLSLQCILSFFKFPLFSLFSLLLFS